MDLTALVFSSGWASGVNAYATVAVLGVIARLDDRAPAFAEVVPEVFGRPAVLAAALLMFALEFVVDKVPWLDSLWDTVSTVVRPLIGAVVASQLSADASSVDQALLTVLGGGTALTSHGVKSGLRLAVNTSPEPFSNGVVSLGEDVSVIGVMLLALAHPWWALGISAGLLVTGLVLVFLLWRAIRTAWRRRRPPPRVAASPD